jgi:hypothetical protein
MGFLRNMLATHYFDTDAVCVMCGGSRELLIQQNELGHDISCHVDDSHYQTEGVPVNTLLDMSPDEYTAFRNLLIAATKGVSDV